MQRLENQILLSNFIHKPRNTRCNIFISIVFYESDAFKSHINIVRLFDVKSRDLREMKPFPFTDKNSLMRESLAKTLSPPIIHKEYINI